MSSARTMNEPATLKAVNLPVTTLGVLCLSFFCIAFDNAKLIVAMPTLARVFASEPSWLNWIPEAYLLVYASLLMLGGALSERWGPRRMLLVGLTIFAGMSAAGALVHSARALIAARALTAIGGALITPATLALVKTSFHPDVRARAIAVWTASYGVGAALGPLVSGLLLERWGWGAVLLANAPVALLAFAGTWRILPRDVLHLGSPLDWLGTGLALGATGSLVFALLEAPRTGWSSAPVLGGAAAAVLLYALLVVWIRGAAHPMLDKELFRTPRFALALAVILTAYLAFSGVSFVVAQYLQLARAFEPTRAGVLAAPLALAMLAGNLLGPRLRERAGARRALVGSLLVGAAGSMALGWGTGRADELILCTAMVPFAAGCGSAFVHATEVVMSLAPASRAGSAAALNESAFEFGGVVGVAVLSGVFGSGALYPDALGASATRAMWIGSAALLIASAFAATLESARAQGARPVAPAPRKRSALSEPTP